MCGVLWFWPTPLASMKFGAVRDHPHPGSFGCAGTSQPSLLIVGLVFVVHFSLLVVVYLLTKEGRRNDAYSRLHDGCLFPFGARPLWHAFVFHGQL